MLDLIHLKVVSLKPRLVPWPAEVPLRRALSISFTHSLSSQIMAGGEKKVGNSEPRRQEWEKSCVLWKEKAHETGDTETGGTPSLCPQVTQVGRSLKSSKGKFFE